MIELREQARRYLEASCPGAEAFRIGGGASTRLFWRVRSPEGRSRVLMDCGQPFQDETDDVRLSRVFRRAGLRVAEILDVSAATGCLLLEDLGDTSLAAALVAAGSGTNEARRLLERAVILAARVADRGTPVLAGSDRSQGPSLDAERFRFEMDYFLEHYVGGLRGCSPPPAGLRETLHALADRAAETPRNVLCHRDFHSRNLMVPPDGSLAMVDIQDARWGPDTYDLASLVRDAYVEFDESWIEPLVDLYLSSLNEPPAAGFRTRLLRVSAQRMIKALGTFGYQATVRREKDYLQAASRTLRRLRLVLPALPETRPLHDSLLEAGLLNPTS